MNIDLARAVSLAARASHKYLEINPMPSIENLKAAMRVEEERTETNSEPKLSTPAERERMRLAALGILSPLVLDPITPSESSPLDSIRSAPPKIARAIYADVVNVKLR